MKTMMYAAFALTACLLAGCSQRTDSNHSDSRAVEVSDAERRGMPQAMQVSDAVEEMEYRGKRYRTQVVRRPDESLPVVSNEQGEQFVDNRITLRVTCEGRKVLEKVFTKSDFASWVDARFLRYAILEALVFDEVTASGLAFSASVCYPQTDLYIPLRVTVGANGGLSIEREELEQTPVQPDSLQ